MSGKLYVVGTPIGNLEDITLRALRVLKEVDLVAAEDTRRTGLLLKNFEISKPLISCHAFNEASRLEKLLERLNKQENIALVSDSGMPAISDPGGRLITKCLGRGILVEIVPGPSAILHALVASGLNTDSFYFGGFLPVKSGARQKELEQAGERKCTSIYFESPHRLLKTLEACASLFPQRNCCVARELTKKFEEVVAGTPEKLKAHFEKKGVKGEITFLIQEAEYKSHH